MTKKCTYGYHHNAEYAQRMCTTLGKSAFLLSWSIGNIEMLLSNDALALGSARVSKTHIFKTKQVRSISRGIRGWSGTKVCTENIFRKRYKSNNNRIQISGKKYKIVGDVLQSTGNKGSRSTEIKKKVILMRSKRCPIKCGEEMPVKQIT